MKTLRDETPEQLAARLNAELAACVASWEARLDAVHAKAAAAQREANQIARVYVLGSLIAAVLGAWGVTR